MRREIQAAVRGGSLGREVSKQAVMPVLQELKLNQSCKWDMGGDWGKDRRLREWAEDIDPKILAKENPIVKEK